MNTSQINEIQFEALKKFTHQINFSLTNYTPHGLKISDYTNIVVAGLGGSGIGGRIAKAWFNEKLPLPFEIISDYVLPAYVNEKSFVVLSSYSGNTEETLSMYEDAIARGCRPIIITTGGKILEKATTAGLKVLSAEKGYQPRMALCYPLTHLYLIFAELLGEEEAMKTELQACIERINTNEAEYTSQAEELLTMVKKQIPQKVIVVADAQLEAIGLRFCQQIQENSKHEAFLHVLPEANHNVIESYYGNIPSVFFFLRSGVNPRVESRFDFLTSLLEVEYHKVINMILEEYNLGSVLSLIYRLDAFTLQLANLRMVNAVDVPNIASLKEFLEGMEGEA